MHALNSDTPVQSHLSNHPIHDLVSAANMTVELRVQYACCGNRKLETVCLSFNVAAVVLQAKYSVFSSLVLIVFQACSGIVGDVERMQRYCWRM